MLRSLFDLNLKFDRTVVTITIASTLLLIVDYYRRITFSKALDRIGLYLLIPLVIIIFVFRESPKNFGFQWGDWRAGLKLTALAVGISAPILWWVARGDSSMQAYYAWQLSPWMPLENFIDLLGWEFFFRGFILFGYARKFDDHALWLQAVPFALAHISKPEIETLSTIFGGFIFGLIAWRTRSFIYPLLIHWFVATFTVLAAAGFLG